MGGYDFANVRAHAWKALWSAGKVLCLHLGGDYKGVWLVNPNTVDLIVVLCHGYGKWLRALQSSKPVLISYLGNGGSKEDWLNPDNNFLYTPIFSLPLPEKYTLSPGAHEGREESHKAGILWGSKTSCSFFLSGGCIFIITNLLKTGMVTQTKSAKNCHGIQGLTSSLSPIKGSPGEEAWVTLHHKVQSHW